MAINQLSSSNTFQHWLIATQQLIAFANTITDGGEGTEFIVNTNMTVNGTVNTRNVITQSLRVTGQSSLNIVIANSIFTNTINANVVSANIARVNTLIFADGTTLNSNSFIATLRSEIQSVNTYVTGPILLKINSGYDKANDAYSHAVGAFNKANTVDGLSTYSISSFNKANSANVLAQTARDRANGAYQQANLAFDKANTGVGHAEGAFLKANSALTSGSLDGFVTLTTSQSITGLKTFTQTISGSINGNANTVDNGFYIAGPYASNQYVFGRKMFRQFRELAGSKDAIAPGSSFPAVSLNSGVYGTSSQVLDLNLDLASMFFVPMGGQINFVGTIGNGEVTCILVCLFYNVSQGILPTTFAPWGGGAIMWAGGGGTPTLGVGNNLLAFLNTGYRNGTPNTNDWFGINLGIGFPYP